MANHRSLPVLLLMLPVVALAASRSDLQPPAKRKATIDLAEQIATETGPAPLAAELNNPFSQDANNLADADELRAKSGNQKALSDKDVVEMIAARIGSVSSVYIGGQHILLIHQKKVKKGDRLSISFDAKDYEVDITDINPTTFSIRFNGIEVTRPISIKPGKTP